MSKYKHGEAFCLMHYQNTRTGQIEMVWNSRDGVTPFEMRSMDGSDTMRHVQWEKDKCLPNYEPVIGMRIFIDLTIENARRYRAAQLARMGDAMRSGFEDGTTDEQIIEELAQGDIAFGGGGAPDVVTVSINGHKTWLDMQEGQ